MMKIIALLAFVGVSTALPSTDAIVPDTILVEVSAFNEAKATVQSMITAGKDEGACADLAAATMKEVQDSVDGQQKMLDSLDTGADCPNKGQAAVDAAQGALDQANKDKQDADAAAATAANADVNFGPKPLSGLTPGNCESFFSDPAYTSAKAAEESAKQAAIQAAGAVSAAEAGLKAAQDAQKAAIAECQCAAKKGYEDAWEAANSNNAANEKAYTKGKHMACVLAGTPPADCDVGAIPKVTAITLAAGTQDANCEAPAPQCTGDVIAYQHNFGGWAAKFPRGKYYLADARKKGFVNDDMSSIVVPEGCVATVWQHNFGGWHTTFPAGKYNLSQAKKMGFRNDDASSIVVNDAECASTASVCGRSE